MRRSSDFDHRRSLSSAIGWAFLLAAAVAFALMLVGWLLAGRVDAQEMELDPFGEVDLPEQQDPDVEPLMRGPLHEAFAEQVNLDPQPGPIIPREPPQPIAEIPPEVKPDGENVEWIPGYWAWDEAEERFLWVSGVWRAVPREIRWVPGRWAEVDGGFQWISGYWISRNVVAEPELLPTPPASVEQGPSTEPPGDDYFWVPGCWVWRSDVYHWRSGFWQAVQPGWIWIPSRN